MMIDVILVLAVALATSGYLYTIWLSQKRVKSFADWEAAQTVDDDPLQYRRERLAELAMAAQVREGTEPEVAARKAMAYAEALLALERKP